MWVDHRKKLLFVHVPRTGGDSICSVMGGKAGQFPKHIGRHKARLPKYFAFGFIRNPWGRLYSCYRKHAAIDERYRNISFREFLYNTRGKGCEHSAMKLLAGCQFIGRFESLQSDWNRLQRIIGMNESVLPVTNGAGDSEYQSHYDAGMVKYVRDTCSDDIAWGGYSFG